MKAEFPWALRWFHLGATMVSLAKVTRGTTIGIQRLLRLYISASRSARDIKVLELQLTVIPDVKS